MAERNIHPPSNKGASNIRVVIKIDELLKLVTKRDNVNENNNSTINKYLQLLRVEAVGANLQFADMDSIGVRRFIKLERGKLKFILILRA